MDDKRLRALLTAVQCGSFGKATAQLGYTQSAMTHMVNKLEAELGCTLLTRSSHGVRLSEEGEHLLPYIQDYLRASEALRREAAAQGEAHNRVLRIGCFASIARHGCRRCCRSSANCTRRSRSTCWWAAMSWPRRWRRNGCSWPWWRRLAARAFTGRR